ncbi:MAG TPA: hypothetical protein VNQ73_05065 [Ilumatobacter sp.]|nr:hypothetical protein [Ilumatobacter sp.]
MDPDFAQRRRVFVAVAVTAIAVPGVFLFGRADSNAESPTPTTMWSPVAVPGATQPVDPASASAAAASGAAGADESQAAAEGGSHADTVANVLGTTPGGYLGGTVAPGANDVPMIKVPRQRDVLTGSASFSSTIDRVTTCIVPKLRMGTEVTVTNLDNGRKIKCQVAAVAGQQQADVMMHFEAFAQIADITQAPVPVEVSW